MRREEARGLAGGGVAVAAGTRHEHAGGVALLGELAAGEAARVLTERAVGDVELTAGERPAGGRHEAELLGEGVGGELRA